MEGNPDLLCAATGVGRIGIREKGGIVFKHRAAPDGDVYFLANTSDKPAEFTVSLRTLGRQPELWNADSGVMTKAAAFRQQAGRTLVPLRLEPAESIFVVLREPIAAGVAGAASSNTPELAEVATLAGPWTVRFEGQGAPKEIIFETLANWAKHPDAAIRHFSGTAEYEINFNLAALPPGKRTVLHLGKVADIATVTVNGKVAGAAWRSPRMLDISRCVQRGANKLQVRVANSWNNRLVGDAALPVAERQSYVSVPDKIDKQNLLAESGLLGPVRVSQEK